MWWYFHKTWFSASLCASLFVETLSSSYVNTQVYIVLWDNWIKLFSQEVKIKNITKEIISMFYTCWEKKGQTHILLAFQDKYEHNRKRSSPKIHCVSWRSNFCKALVCSNLESSKKYCEKSLLQNKILLTEGEEKASFSSPTIISIFLLVLYCIKC